MSTASKLTAKIITTVKRDRGRQMKLTSDYHLLRAIDRDQNHCEQLQSVYPAELLVVKPLEHLSQLQPLVRNHSHLLRRLDPQLDWGVVSLRHRHEDRLDCFLGPFVQKTASG